MILCFVQVHSAHAHLSHGHFLSKKRVHRHACSRNWTACRMCMRMHCGLNHVSGMLYNAYSFISMCHGMRRDSLPRFPRTTDFGDSQKARLETPGSCRDACFHACNIPHAMLDVHAACHATCKHIERARGRHPSPSGLAAACSAAQRPNWYAPAHAACAACHQLPC